MADTQGLFDALSGAAGAPVDRPKLNAFVANSQAINGLRTAQTDEAMLNAQRSVEEAQARSQLTDHFQASGLKPSDAQLATDLAVGGLGNASQVMDALKTGQQVQANYTHGNPALIGTPQETAASQVTTEKAADPYTTVPTDYTMTPGAPAQGPVQVNPSGAATIAAQRSLAGLHDVQTAAGGFNPHTGINGANLTPDQIAALNTAVGNGRLDPLRINSRNAAIYAGIEMRSPGQTNFNQLHAQAALQSNPAFQQRAITVEALPTLMSHMTSLGKELGYSDWRTVGKMQAFMNGELNDPQYTEYMGVRNDVLMNLANTMRGVGMSDQAHRAEIEAAAPTMSPLALDGWLKGQMSALKPRLEQYQRITGLGTPHQTPNPGTGAPDSTSDLAAAAAAELARRGIAPQTGGAGP